MHAEGLSASEIDARVKKISDTLQLGSILKRTPGQLAEGEKQRVAVGRSIIRAPTCFLFDEPLSNLDAKLRVQTRTQIAALQRRLGTTTVYVTHDQVEALTMGDRIAVLKDGVLQQIGTPREMYDTPANVFVAGFIGSPAMNLSTFKIEDGHALIGDGKLAIPREVLSGLSSEDGDTIVVGFRPESLDRVSPNTEGAFPITVDVVEELGSDAFVYGSIPSGAPGAGEIHFDAGDSEVIVRIDPRDVPKKGDTIWVTIREGEQHVFSSARGDRLSAAVQTAKVL